MKGMGKWLIVFGILLIIAGGLLLLADRYLDGWRLPGDIVIKRENFTFYFPLGSSLLISLIISLILYVISKLK